jgi:hypothetical protein
MPVPKRNEDGTFGTTLIPVPKSLLDEYEAKNHEGESSTVPSDWVKVYITATEPSHKPMTESTVEVTTERRTITSVHFTGPYLWMRPKYSDGGDGSELEPVPKDLVKITEQFNYNIPSDWIKVTTEGDPEATTRRPRTKRTTTTKRPDVWDNWSAEEDDKTSTSTMPSTTQKSKTIGDFINLYILNVIKQSVG